jgi:hypothetical protein
MSIASLIQSRSIEHFLDVDAGLGRDLVHRGEQLGAAMGADLLGQVAGADTGQRADLEDELAVLGGDVVRGAAVDATRMHAGVRKSKPCMAFGRIQSPLQPVEEHDDLGRRLHGRHAAVAR